MLPIDSSFADRMDPALRPNFNAGRTDFTYYPGMIRIPEANSPDIQNKSFRITAEVEIPESGADGVLATQGGRFGGWGLLVLDGKPMFVYAYSNQDGDKYPEPTEEQDAHRRGRQARAGQAHHRFRFRLRRRRPRQGRKGNAHRRWQNSGRGAFEKTIPSEFSLDESFDVGKDTGTPVIDEYDAKMPFKFTGTLREGRDQARSRSTQSPEERRA